MAKPRVTRKKPRYAAEIKIIAAAVAFFLIAANTQTGWLYIMAALLLGMLAAGYIAARHNLKYISVTRRFRGHAVQGGRARAELIIKNHGSYPVHLLAIEENLPANLPKVEHRRRFFVEKLVPGQQAVINYSWPCFQRGLYRLAEVTLSSGAPLGVFPATRRFVQAEAATLLKVRPASPPLKRSRLAHADALHPKRTLTRRGNGQDIRGLHPYQPGEDIRFIHWATSARLNRLMVREFQHPAQNGAIVVIEGNRANCCGQGPTANYEQALAAAAAIIKETPRNGGPTRLIFQEKQQLKVISGPCSEQLDSLAVVSPGESMPWPHFCQAAHRYVVPGIPIYLLAVSPSLQSEDLSYLGNKHLIKVALFMQYEQDFSNDRQHLAPNLAEYQAALTTLKQSGRRIWLHTPADSLPELIQQLTSVRIS